MRNDAGDQRVDRGEKNGGGGKGVKCEWHGADFEAEDGKTGCAQKCAAGADIFAQMARVGLGYLNLILWAESKLIYGLFSSILPRLTKSSGALIF